MEMGLTGEVTTTLRRRHPERESTFFTHTDSSSPPHRLNKKRVPETETLRVYAILPTPVLPGSGSKGMISAHIRAPLVVGLFFLGQPTVEYTDQASRRQGKSAAGCRFFETISSTPWSHPPRFSRYGSIEMVMLSSMSGAVVRVEKSRISSPLLPSGLEMPMGIIS